MCWQVAIPFFSFPKSLERDRQKVKEWNEEMEATRRRNALIKSQSSGGTATASTAADHQSREGAGSGDGHDHRRNLSTSSMPAIPTPYHPKHAVTSTTVTCHKRNASSASWCVMMPHTRNGRSAPPGPPNKHFSLFPFIKREHGESGHQDEHPSNTTDEHHRKCEPVEYGRNIKGT